MIVSPGAIQSLRLSRRQVQIPLHGLGDTVNDAVTLAIVEETSLLDTGELSAEDASRLDEVVLGDGVVGDRLVDDGCVVSDVGGGDDGVVSVVLVGVLDDDGLNDVVYVVVNSLVDGLTLVDDLASLGCNLDTVTVTVSVGDGVQELGILGGRSVLLLDVCPGDDPVVVLFSGVLAVTNALDVVLDVVVVALQVLLTRDLVDVVSLSGLLGNVSQVLNILVHLTVEVGGAGLVVVATGVSGQTVRLSYGSRSTGVRLITTLTCVADGVSASAVRADQARATTIAASGGVDTSAVGTSEARASAVGTGQTGAVGTSEAGRLSVGASVAR